MKKYMPVLVTLVLFAAGILFVLPGFQKRTDVYLQDYFVSGENPVIIVKTFPAGSMGLSGTWSSKPSAMRYTVPFIAPLAG